MEQEKPMTAEDFHIEKLNNIGYKKEAIDWTTSEFESRGVYTFAELFKDSHTAPLQVEIDRLKKEVEMLKLSNSESLEYISRIIELIRLGDSINVERRLKHLKRVIEEGASCIYECDLTTSMNCKHCGKSKWQHFNQ